MSEKKEYHNRDEFIDDDGTTTEEKIEIARHVWETEELLYKWEREKKLKKKAQKTRPHRNKKGTRREGHVNK